ncbi:unnamed protein product, partial [Rotaria sp. Silwood1]
MIPTFESTEFLYSFSFSLDNTCEWNFQSIVTYPCKTGERPWSIVVSDLNNDNKMDIIVTNPDTDHVGIFFGDDNGTFAPQKIYSTGSYSDPKHVAVGDLNSDSLLDIIVANYGTNNVGVFFGQGNGTFAVQKTFSTVSSRPKYVAVGDFNNDDHLDIAIVQYGTSGMGVMLGYGNSTFGALMTYSTGFDSNPSSVAIGDFNNDKLSDIAVANTGTNDIGIFLAYENGTFASQTTYSTSKGSKPISVTCGDINNDNITDIVVANSGTRTIGILIGYRNGTFSEQAIIATTTWIPRSVAVGDFNNDNQLDIFLAVSYFIVARIIIYRGYDKGTFVMHESYPARFSTGSYPFVVADINNDNRLDIIVANYLDYSIGLILGHVNETSADRTIVSTGSSSEPYTIAVGDFNNDHNLDMAVGNAGSNQVSVFLGYGTGNFASQKLYPTGFQSFPQSIAIGDFDNNRKLDIIVANPGTDNVGIFFGYGNGSFEDQVIYSTGPSSRPSSVVIADFNNDNQTDIVVANMGTGTIGIFLGHGDGT